MTAPGGPGAPAPRLALAAWGSAGDLLPFLAPLGLLAGPPSSRVALVPRAQGAYLRSLGWPSISLGDGSEVNASRDPSVLTSADDGWASWRRLEEDYLAPFVARAAGHPDAGTAWGCGAVMATDFAVHGRLAAARARVPSVTLSIYPQRLRQPSRVGLGGLEAAVGDRWAGPDVRAVVAGDPERTVLLHDPALVGDDFAVPPAGFPDFAGFPPTPAEAALEGWLAAGRGPTVAVSMGSFLGGAVAHRWSACVDATLSAAARCVLVGAPPAVVDRHHGDPRVTAVPWARHHWLLPQVDAVVHHGGLGTVFAALRATCPAVVLPIAFDQGHNARLVEAAGAGVDATDLDVGVALRRVLRAGDARDRVTALADRLVAPDVAAATVADRCADLLGWGG